MPHALGKSFHTRMPCRSQAAKNSSRSLLPTQLRIMVKFMSRCIRTAAFMRSAGIRRSSSSQPQLPPRASTRTPLTLIFSGSGVFDTDLTSVHVSPSSDTWMVYDFGYAVSQTTATRSNVREEPRSTRIHWWSS